MKECVVVIGQIVVTLSSITNTKQVEIINLELLFLLIGNYNFRS